MEYITTDTALTAIANAIRTKGGTSETLEFPDDFVTAIGDITTGVVEAKPKVLNFYDYDGTRLYSYTAEETQALTELPANPSHDGLIAQGWNWSLADIKIHVQKYGRLDVGQMYTTATGNTEIDIEVPVSGFDPSMPLRVDGDVEVDWGDGTTGETVTGSSLSTTVYAGPHTYAQPGAYTIRIRAIEGEYKFYCDINTSYLLLTKYTGLTPNKVFVNAIKAVRIGTGITKIGNWAFAYCGSLQSITIPNTVTSIDSGAFAYCWGLRSITIPNFVTSSPGFMFTDCYALKTVSLPNTITTLGGSTFKNCYSLDTVVIPDSVTILNDGMFKSDSGLSHLIIPEEVTKITYQAFYGCSGVSEYHFHPTSVPELGTDVFTNISPDCVIYVPYSEDHSILNDYKTATNWQSWASYIQEEPE